MAGLKSSERNDGEIQNRLTKTFVLMIGALMCCYIPTCTAVYYMNLCRPCNCDVIEWLRDLVFWLILLNSAIDPFIYALRTKPFRKAARDILFCKCKKINNVAQQKYIARFSRNNGYKTPTAQLLPKQKEYGSITTETSELCT